MNQEDKTQDEKIQIISNKLETKVSWVIFVWAVALIVGMFGIGLTISASTASTMNDNATKAVDTAIDATNQVNRLDNRVTSVETKQTAQFDEVLRSLDRLEKRFGTK